MSKVYYGADSNRLIPAPLVSITKNYQKSGDGTIIGKIYNLTLTGTIVAWMGSPYSDGAFYNGSGYPADEVVDTNSRLAAVQRKQEGIRNLFSVEGEKLEIQTASGLTSVRCYPRIISIEFAEGIWHDRCDYTITLECDELYGGVFAEEDSFDEYIADASESWSIETNEDYSELFGVPKTYSLTHSISANGKRFYNNLGDLEKEAWEQARDWVLPRLGLDNDVVASFGVLNLPSYYTGYNHSRGENTDKKGGVFSVTETWILASGAFTEDFNVRSVSSLDDPYVTVNIEGNVKGYDITDDELTVTTDKWTNAQTKFVYASGLALTRAQQFSGETLNIRPQSETFGFNPIQGTITYDFEFNTRPSNLITNAKKETISINDNFGGEKFAAVFVLGRAKGPVLQDLGTKEANTRSLNIEIIVDPPTTTNAKEMLIDKNPYNDLETYGNDIRSVISAVTPTTTPRFQDQPQMSWDAKQGLFSYTCNWTYEL